MKYKITIIFLLIFSFFFANYNLASKKELTYKINEVFPQKFNEWKGTDIKADKVVYTMIDPDEFLFRRYEYKDKKIYLTIVLTNKRDHIHDPQVCYRGQGVNMDNQIRIQFGKDINAYMVNADKNQAPYKIIYWYFDQDKTYSSRSEFMKHIIISNILNKPAFNYSLIAVSGANISEEDLKDFSYNVSQKLYEISKNNKS